MRTVKETYMQQAIQLSLDGMRAGEGGPFGAVVVRDDLIVGRGRNRVIALQDPTAHAEMEAIREACRHRKSFDLNGCEIYASCEPCPMCLGAIYWSRLNRVYYAAERKDAAAAGFDDDFIYREFEPTRPKRRLQMEQLLREKAVVALREWAQMEAKVEY